MRPGMMGFMRTRGLPAWNFSAYNALGAMTAPSGVSNVNASTNTTSFDRIAGTITTALSANSLRSARGRWGKFGLLIEPARTNSMLDTRLVTTGAWTAGTATTTAAGAGTNSPDSSQNAGQENGTAGEYGTYNTIGTLAAGTYTGSAWYMPASANQSYQSTFGKFVASQAVGISGTALPLSIWTWLTNTTTVSAPNIFYFFSADGRNQSTYSGTQPGTVAQDIDIDCMQVEIGSYETSYIKTVGSTASRNADAPQITNTSVLAGISSGQLSWMFDFEALASLANYSTDSSKLYLYSDPNDATTYISINVSTGAITISVSGTTNTTSAVTWNQGDRVQIFIAAGGSIATTAYYRTAPYSTFTFGSEHTLSITGSALGNFAPSGVVNIFQAAGTDVLSCVAFEIQPYATGKGPSWI